MVLLIVLKNEDIHGAKVAREYIEIFKKHITLPAIITVLKRLEKKGFLRSKMAEAVPERGGKRKRLYAATNQGYEIAREIQMNRNGLWKFIPAVK